MSGRVLYVGLWVLCIALALADLVYHKHVTFEAEEWTGFFALFGFVGCALLALVARLVRAPLKREEDYYDR